MTLHKVDGQWKLSIYSSYKKPVQLELTNQMFQRIAKYTNAVAKQISEGEFTTVGDVQKELKRQRLLMNQEMVPKLQKAI